MGFEPGPMPKRRPEISRAPKSTVYIRQQYGVGRRKLIWSTTRRLEHNPPRHRFARSRRAEAHEKRPPRPCWCREHGSERPRSRERRRPRALCEAIEAAAVDAACLGSGSAAKPPFATCVGRLSVADGTARARWPRQVAAPRWAETLRTTAFDGSRALRPMLPASAREHWPSFVLRDSCHAALPDQPGLP